MCVFRWRYQQRGGYTESDNPTIQFRLDHPDIMQKLATESVYDLTPGEQMLREKGNGNDWAEGGEMVQERLFKTTKR